MGRPPTKPTALRDGFYIEIRNSKSSHASIKLRRDTLKELKIAIEEYSKSKHVTVLGECKSGKWIEVKV